MTRHALALPMLLATLICVVLPASALADPGQGHGKGQRDDSSYAQSGNYRDESDDQRGNGKGRGQQSDRSNSNQKHPSSDNYERSRNRSDNSGRGNSNQKYRTSDDNDDYNRSRSDNLGRAHSNQQYRDNGNNYNNNRQGQQSRALSAQSAAQRARSQYGGQVLKVQPSNNGYQVRLLKDDGRVVTVPIAD